MATEVESGGLETHPPVDPPPPSSPKDVAAVRAYVQSSPLFPQLGLDDASSTDAAAESWADLAETLCSFLRLDPEDLVPAAAARVYRHYVPAYLWCVGRLERHRRREETSQKSDERGSPARPLVVGLTAPQGCGKTTLVAALAFLFARRGVSAASASIDDVYLTGAEQEAVAAANPGNALLRYRGNAGTHDVGLALDTLRALRGINAAATRGVAVPRYDKTARGGRGDRAPRETWPEVTAPLDIVLFEGWMLGFEPAADAEAAAAHPDLPAVNAGLRDGKYGAMHALVDDWIVVRVEDTRWVQTWRLEAEQQARRAGRPTLTDAEVADFVRRFAPAYDLYAGALYARGPWRGEEGAARDASRDAGSVFVVEVDAARRVVGGRR